MLLLWGHSVPWDMQPPHHMGWWGGEGQVCHRQSRTGGVSSGRRWLHEDKMPGQRKTQVEVIQRRGERRKKDALLGRAGVEMDRTALPEGTQRGHLLQLTP